MSGERIGELLTRRRIVATRDVEEVLRLQREVGGLCGQLLIRTGALSESQLVAALAEQLDLPVAAAEEMPDPEEVLALLAEDGSRLDWWAARQAVAWRPQGDRDQVACVSVQPLDPALRERLDKLAEQVEHRIAPRALVAGVHEALARRARADAAAAPGGAEADRLRELAQETPVVELVNGLFAEAVERRASDVHIEPFEHDYVVRMRVDGLLTEVRSGRRADFDAVCSRIKLL